LDVTGGYGDGTAILAHEPFLERQYFRWETGSWETIVRDFSLMK
jgi:hypothetical protein